MAGAPALAQSDEEEEAAEVEEIVVTGSKLRRDAFSTISPVQVIGGQESVRIGNVDAASMIAETPFVTGPQLDGSTNSGTTTAAVEGVPASGPGAATVALRGLGPERTLLLVNGRRLAPSGVRGAPVAPDLNLIPSSLIERIEILTDGASSIYGADAVAGVANIILRQDVEGIEVQAFGSQPTEDGGEEYQLSFIGGASNDRGNFTLAAEIFDRSHVFAGDRPNFNDCLRDIETTPDGRTVSVCADRRPDNAVFIGSQGFVYSTPGTTDIGVPGFSTQSGAAAFIGRPAEPGQQLLGSDTPYNLQDEELATQLQDELERINIYATADFELVPGHNLYIEASYAQRQNTGIFTSEQAFPGVPALIPQEDADGNIIVDGDGAPVLVDNPLNPFDEDALPVNTLKELSQRRETDVDNMRFVAGLEGDIGVGGLAERGWVYDVFASFEESSGTSVQAGILEPHIRESLDTLRLDADGNAVCGLPRTALSFGFLTPAECVVVDWFADSLFTTTGGTKEFATQEETDFLFGNVINTTELTQTHLSGLVTGDLFEFNGRTVGLVLGAEWRENAIDSANDIVRAQALSASENPDQEADTVGETSLWEVYLETEVPFSDMFTMNLSGRFTDEENFGSEFTYSVKADFMPLDWLRLRATFGTTFRAPNLREQFLAGQTGTIAGVNDPCVVPTTAIGPGNTYDPAGETRPQIVLDNCNADGVDPTALGLQANVAIPTQTGGSDEIEAETSDSYTAGIVLSQPWTDAFDFDFSLTYFDIEVEDTVEELDAANILNRCYNDEPGLVSPLCDRVVRRGVNPANNTVSLVDSSFVNVGLVTSKGFDINARYMDSLSFGGRAYDVSLSLTATHQAELKEQLEPTAPIDDRVGEVGRPEWSWIARADIAYGNWEFLWRTRFIGEFDQDPDDITLSNNSTTSPCNVLLDLTDPGGGNGPCTETGFGDSVMYHDLSLSYLQDEWSVTAGVRNVFDEEPPLINQGEGPARLNIVVQSGYDLFGRRFFLTANRRF